LLNPCAIVKYTHPPTAEKAVALETWLAFIVSCTSRMSRAAAVLQMVSKHRILDLDAVSKRGSYQWEFRMIGRRRSEFRIGVDRYLLDIITGGCHARVVRKKAQIASTVESCQIPPCNCHRARCMRDTMMLIVRRLLVQQASSRHRLIICRHAPCMT
jgi:hypothetical protein